MQTPTTATAPHPSSAQSTRRPPRVAPGHLALVIVGAVLLVFGRVHSYEFLGWDDNVNVTQNPYVRPVGPKRIARIWRQPYKALYIPVTYTFLAGEAYLAGANSPGPMNPRVFHLGNLLLHAAAALMVFAILRRLVDHHGAACFGALFYAMHPLQVESVAWISEVKGLLAGLFSWVAIWQYLCYATADRPTSIARDSAVANTARRARYHYAIATAALFLAILSKPSAVAVPALVAALDIGLLRRPWQRTCWSLAPWCVISASCVIATHFMQSDKILYTTPI